MKKQTFLLLAAIYSALIGLVLIFVPDVLFQSYGFPKIDDIPHDILLGTAKDFMFYTGANSLAFGVVFFISREGANNKAVLLGGAVAIIACALFAIYRNGNSNTPIVAWIDMAVRLAAGLGLLYYYFKEKE